MADSPALSVVVPTYNRKDVLAKCLDALLKQSVTGFEVIVVDDGSTDGTGGMVRSRFGGTEAVRYMRQENFGPAAARNLGAEGARGGIICFIDDDIIAGERLLEEHLSAHRENPEERDAVLGFVAWSPEVRVTPFMHWLEHGGGEFRYGDLEDGKYAGYDYCYSCNISYKRAFLMGDGGFDPQFKMAMWEDLELAYRLSKRGLRALYRKGARAWHYREVTIRQFMKRNFNIGRYSLVFHAKHPEAVKIEKMFALLNPLLPVDDAVMDRLADGFDNAGHAADVAGAAGENAWFYDLAARSCIAKGALHELFFRELLTPDQAETCMASLGHGAFDTGTPAGAREFVGFIERTMKERAFRRWEAGDLTGTLMRPLKEAERFLRRRVLKPYVLKPFQQ